MTWMCVVILFHNKDVHVLPSCCVAADFPPNQDPQPLTSHHERGLERGLLSHCQTLTQTYSHLHNHGACTLVICAAKLLKEQFNDLWIAESTKACRAWQAGRVYIKTCIFFPTRCFPSCFCLIVVVYMGKWWTKLRAARRGENTRDFWRGKLSGPFLKQQFNTAPHWRRHILSIRFRHPQKTAN